jgi:cytidylate kinase
MINIDALSGLSHPLHGTIQESLTTRTEHGAGGGNAAAPFVTVSRQAGVSGRTIAHLLAQRLNTIDPGSTPWAVWDRPLMEKVAEEHNLTLREIESLENAPHSWLWDLLGNVSLSNTSSFHDEFVVYRRVARAIRALATKGRVIIVGRGGAYITHNMPGGVHLRFVAPLEYRIAATSSKLGIPPDQAKRNVLELDENRESFCRRYFHHDALAPEMFTATINVAELSHQQIVDCIIPMLDLKVYAPAV